MTDDLISKRGLREAMYHEAMEKDSDEQRWDGGCWIRYKLFERVLDSMPTADVPERKVGKWVKNEYNSGWHCSECKEDDFYAYVWNSDDKMYDLQDHYCPNCGARMKGENDGKIHKG